MYEATGQRFWSIMSCDDYAVKMGVMMGGVSGVVE